MDAFLIPSSFEIFQVGWVFEAFEQLEVIFEDSPHISSVEIRLINRSSKGYGACEFASWLSFSSNRRRACCVLSQEKDQWPQDRVGDHP